MASPNNRSRKLIYAWIGIFSLFWIVLVGHFFVIQVLEGEEWAKRIPQQSKRRLTLEPQRGIIYDRNFNMLAFNLARFSFGANPGRVKHPQKIAAQLAKVTGESAEFYLKRLRSKKSFVWLTRGMLPEQVEQLKFPPSSGITTIKKSQRFYPNHNLASQVIGFANIDNLGISGVELQYDELLQGKTGWKVILVDATHKPVAEVELPEKSPVDGCSLVLTIDREYQMIAEDELEKGIEKYGAKGGVVVMLDPRSGEVLAMTSLPDYDPNFPGKFSAFEQKNRVITDGYEPGSPFKIVTAAAALEKHIVSPRDKIDCENGVYRVPGGRITDHKRFSVLTFQQVIENSSNIGMAKIAQKVGADQIYRYARAFGIGNPTGIDLPGEIAGVLRNPVYWSASDLYRIAIGYGVLVTPLQLACAYAAIANNGILMKPRVVKAVLSEHGEILEEKEPVTIRRVVSESTAKILRQFFTGVVERGTGIRARIAGVKVAGKTGTARKYDPKAGKYSDKRFIATFVGFLPADNPTLVCLVMMDEPRNSYYGGQTCAPVFNRIVRRVLDLMQSKQILAAQDLNYSFSSVSQQGSFLLCGARNHEMQLTSRTPTTISDNQIVLPDLRRMSLRDAVKLLTDIGCKAKIIGTGRVVAQQPDAGTVVSKGQLCVIYGQPKM